jgi:FkbM family methyltransferase
MQNLRIKLVNRAKNLFEFFGVAIISVSRLKLLYSELAESRKSDLDFKFLQALPLSNLLQIFPLLRESKSQLRQDLFVLSELNFKKNGFFVEFGATNGKDLSNTYLLEKNFGWKGILSEPAKIWKAEIETNRPHSFIETNCVWNVSHLTLKFNETKEPELSTINIYSEKDGHSLERKSGNHYDVSTISLNDLLKKYNAPHYIDYISIDTEGSEFEILNAFDFNEYIFGIITCEHNFTANREKIHDLLFRNGYIRKYENVSGFDDWYTRKK